MPAAYQTLAPRTLPHGLGPTPDHLFQNFWGWGLKTNRQTYTHTFIFKF
jgi:hypothetical protein